MNLRSALVVGGCLTIGALAAAPAAFAQDFLIYSAGIIDADGNRQAGDDKTIPEPNKQFFDQPGDFDIVRFFSGGTPVLEALFDLHDVHVNKDPFVKYQLDFQNESDQTLGGRLLLRTDSAIFQGPLFHAIEKLDVRLIDRNGDGATLTPHFTLFDHDAVGNITGVLSTTIQDGFRGIRAGVSTFGFSFSNGLEDAPITVPTGGDETFHFSRMTQPFADYIDSVTFPFAGFGDDPPWNNLGVQLEFLISPGDEVILTGSVEVSNVPEPTGIALLGLLGLAAPMRSRRRR
ncbi:MAG: hypothetical protein GC162_15450 [Planctomycetes bacterium]|nr:hypothetical protein [Planctomycetota bacterium]